MRIKVTWTDGSSTDLDVRTLGELDALVGSHERDGAIADLKPLERNGLRLIFRAGARPTPAGARSASH